MRQKETAEVFFDYRHFLQVLFVYVSERRARIMLVEKGIAVNVLRSRERRKRSPGKRGVLLLFRCYLL